MLMKNRKLFKGLRLKIWLIVTETDKVPATAIKTIKTITWWIIPFCIDVTWKADKHIYEQNVSTSYIYGRF